MREDRVEGKIEETKYEVEEVVGKIEETKYEVEEVVLGKNSYR